MLLELLSKPEEDRLHEATLRILGDIGVRVDDPQERDLLRDIGCTVAGDRVRIPETIVEATLARVPRQFSLYGRGSRPPEVRIGNHEPHGQGISGLPSVVDLETGQRRDMLRRDVADAATVQDYLSHIDITSPVGQPRDIPHPSLAVPYEFAVTLAHTTKPIGAVNVESGFEVRYLAQLAAAVRGDMDALRQRPLMLIGLSATSPLIISANIVGVLRELARLGLPYRLLPSPILGATGPVTIAGSVAQQSAEVLASIVVGYLHRPGLPVVYCSRISTLDMRTGLSIWGNPEVAVASVWAAQLCRRYGIPFDFIYSTSSKVPDAQNGYENAYLVLLASLCGADFVTGAGGVADIVIFNLEQLVIDNEILEMVARVRRPYRVTEETLALSAIQAAVAGETFLGLRHTRDHVRAGASWMPDLTDRQDYETWAKGGSMAIGDRARQKVRGILQSHRPEALSAEVHTRLDEILAEAQGEAE